MAGAGDLRGDTVPDDIVIGVNRACSGYKSAASAVLVTDHHIIGERCRFQRGIDG